MLDAIAPAFSQAPPSAPVRAARHRVELALQEAMGRLTVEERVFLKLRYLHGLSVVEIARAFHLEPASFRGRYRRLLRDFRTMIDLDEHR